jgi:hypothetical protein
MLIIDLNKSSFNYLYELNIETKKILYLLSIKLFNGTHKKTEKIQDSKMSVYTYEFDKQELSYIFFSNPHDIIITKLIEQLSEILFKFNIKEFQGLKISPLILSSTFTKNILELKVSSEVLPLIKDLYSIEKDSETEKHNFESEYSAIFYRILKRKNNRKRIIYDLDELREELGTTYVTEEETVINYEKWGQFKEKVIEIAKNELELRSDIYFDYEPLYKGRKIVELLIKPLFKPEVKNKAVTYTQKVAIKSEINTNLNKLVSRYKIPKWQLDKYLKIYSTDEINEILKHVYYSEYNSYVTNIKGYLRNILEEKTDISKTKIEADCFYNSTIVDTENKIVLEKIQSYTNDHPYKTWKKDLKGFISFNEMMFDERKSFSIKKTIDILTRKKDHIELKHFPYKFQKDFLSYIDPELHINF